MSGRKTPIFAIGWSSPLLKVAVHVLLASMVTAPLAQPVPLQPAKVEPAEAVAIKVTRVPLLKVAEQVLPQLMPVGVLVTVPLAPATARDGLYYIDGKRGRAAPV